MDEGGMLLQSTLLEPRRFGSFGRSQSRGCNLAGEQLAGGVARVDFDEEL